MKFKSISARLTAQIALLMLSFSLILLAANSLLLKPLYDYSVQNNMLSGMESLSEIDYAEDAEQWSDKISNIDPGHVYDIMIIKEDEILYSSSMEFGIQGPQSYKPTKTTDGENRLIGDDKHLKREQEKFSKLQLSNMEAVRENVYAGILKTSDKNLSMYVMRTTLEDGTQINLTQGLEPIQKSVIQANVLLGLVTAVFFLVALIMAQRISKNFTKPIRDMKNHVNKLSQLEFNESLQIQTNDELESLSHDINFLSDKLQSALETLTQQNMQLEKDIDSQKRFISNASHELRTPLALIKGYADEIDQGYVSDMKQQQLYIHYISEESLKMKRLLNEILELSRLESGRLEFMPIKENVKGSIEAFLEKYTGFIEENALDVTLDLEDVCGSFDPIRFEQILANYISNAGKYGDEKKRVHIEAKKVEKGIRITVTNTGGPIKKETMDFLWDGFYKADDARAYDEASYGLGLSIVKAIQEISGHKFGCYNGAGTVSFWFDIDSA